MSEQTVQTEFGEFRLYAYQDSVSLEVHLALAHGRLDGPEAPLVRVHVADTLRDLARRAGRGARLDAARGHAAHRRGGQRRGGDAAPAGARARAGRGAARLAAHRRRQAAPRASSAEARGAVLRTFGVGAQILKDLGVSRMRVLSAPSRCTAFRPSAWRSKATSGKRGDCTPQLIEGEVSARGRKVAIVAARFNDFIVASLLKGAHGAWLAHGGAARGPTGGARAGRLRAAGGRRASSPSAAATRRWWRWAA